MRTLASAIALTMALGAAAPASAHEAGDWLFRVGASLVDPKSNNGSFGPGLGIDVDDKWGVTFNVAYMFTPNWAVEVLAALPYRHDIAVGPLGNVASVKHLPPTVSVQYHFAPAAAFQPYVGAGVNYTHFWDDQMRGALAAGDITTDTHSFGLALQAGFDFVIDRNWFLNFDVRWIDISTDAVVVVPGVGRLTSKVAIDPMVYGINVGFRF